jgi:hypothetical protein
MSPASRGGEPATTPQQARRRTLMADRGRYVEIQ